MSDSFRTDIQHLRGIAVLVVVLYHSGQLLPSGFVGVDMFFVISGYVVMKSALPQIASDEFSFWGFIGRRIRRLLPALGVLLSVAILASSLLSSVASRVQTVRTGVFASLMSSNLFLYRFRPDGYFVVTEKSNALLHTWSLSLEEEFYLGFALVVFAAVSVAGKSQSLKLLRVWFSLLLLASFLVNLAASHRSIELSDTPLARLLRADSLDERFAFYMPFTRAWEFLAGAILALLGIQFSEGQRVRRWIHVSGWILVAASLVVPRMSSFPGVYATIPVLGVSALLITPSLFRGNARGLVPRALQWMGDRSYGWYLWHWPIIQFLSPFTQNRWALLTVGLGSLSFAHLSFRYLESPFRRGRRWTGRSRTTILAVVSLTLPLVCISLTTDLEPSLAMHLDESRVCDYQLGFAAHDLGGSCTFRTDNSVGRAALVGDSIAGMYSEGFVQAAHELQLDATLITRGATPFLYLDALSDKPEDTPQRAVVRFLIENKFKLVVLAQANWYQLSQVDEDPRWLDYARPVVTELTNAGIRVLVMAEAPAANVDPRLCSPIQIRLVLCPADTSRTTASLAAQRRGVANDVMLAVGNPRVTFLDVLPLICPQTICEFRRSGEWWWRDGIHLSVEASRFLAPYLRNSMSLLLERKLM